MTQAYSFLPFPPLFHITYSSTHHLHAVRRHLALPTHDIDICPFLAPRVVADTSQLFAQTLVLGHVPHTVVLAAVYGCSAAGTLLEPFAELEVRGARLARRVVASSGLPLSSLRFIGVVGVPFLRGSAVSMMI